MSGLSLVLGRLVAGETLGRAEAENVFGIVLADEVPDVQIGSLLTVLSARGETSEEVAGAAAAMRARMIPAELPDGAIDLCGTGGSGLHTVNVSTAASLVLAGLGIPVAKHGSRAASSLSGASDVLGALGVGMTRPEQAAAVLAEAGLVFLFAPYHHPGVGRLSGVRSTLGFRTVFNVLGPLCNPARVRRQLLGVASRPHLSIMAESLLMSGTERAWIVRGEDGLDELTVCGSSTVFEVRDGRVTEFTIDPQAAGLPIYPEGALTGGTPQENAAALRRLLAGESGAYRDAVVLNAGAALVVAERGSDLAEGVEMAAAALDDGRAAAALDRLVSATTHP